MTKEEIKTADLTPLVDELVKMCERYLSQKNETDDVVNRLGWLSIRMMSCMVWRWELLIKGDGYCIVMLPRNRISTGGLLYHRGDVYLPLPLSPIRLDPYPSDWFRD